MKYLFTVLLLVVTLHVAAQDSITVLQYNLLYYGVTTGFCNNANNNYQNKDNYLRTIIDHTRPDIFTVNELSSVRFYQDNIVSEVLNTNGRKTYKRAPSTNLAGSEIVNMLYYDSIKLGLKSAEAISFYIRDINLYKLYFKTESLHEGDTVFLNCIVAHLKAGDSPQDATTRAGMVSNVLQWLENTETPGNYLIMGDFNLYTDQEEAYQLLTGPENTGPFKFIDPVNRSGKWSNNPVYADVHTQSVTTTGSNCQAGGGMDDRFDFILASSAIMNGTDKVTYRTDSYRAVGQDGLHFNRSITLLPNNSVPPNVLEALGKMSDHLPVRMVLDLNIDIPNQLAENSNIRNSYLAIDTEGNQSIIFTALKPSAVKIEIYNVMGQLLQSNHITVQQGANKHTIATRQAVEGFHIISLIDSQGQRITFKSLK